MGLFDLFKRKKKVEEVKEEDIELIKNNIKKSFQYYRLLTDLEITNDEISKYLVSDVDQKSEIIKFWVKNITGPIKENHLKKIEQIKNEIEQRVRIFEENNIDYDYKLVTENRIYEILRKTFGDDENGFGKLLLGVDVLLDNEYTYIHNEKGLMKVSKVLYDDSSVLLKMKKDLLDYYKDIAKKPLSDNQMNLLAGVSVLSLGIVLLSPGLLSKTLGGGLSLIASIILGGSIVGATYASLSKYNLEVAKKEFRDLSCEEAALLLSIKCLMIDRAKNKLTTEKLKEEIDNLLKTTADLRADNEYLLFVEKENRQILKDKLHMFHNFDYKLCEILNI